MEKNGKRHYHMMIGIVSPVSIIMDHILVSCVITISVVLVWELFHPILLLDAKNVGKIMIC
jgi:hypothetical protein